MSPLPRRLAHSAAGKLGRTTPDRNLKMTIESSTGRIKHEASGAHQYRRTKKLGRKALQGR